jgi:alpha-L-arabinofuranosidase
MQLRRLPPPLFVALLFGVVASRLPAADVSLSVDVGHPAHSISPRMYGIFFEDINFGGDGGLNAELVKNGSFEFPRPLMGWEERGATQSVPGREQGARSQELRVESADRIIEVLDKDPAFSANPHYLRITAQAAGGAAIANEGFRGMGVRAGERYLFSTHARASGDWAASIRLALISRDGTELAAAELRDIGGEWSQHSAVLVSSQTDAEAQLVIALSNPGAVDLDMVSLYPEKTWKNRAHGLRADLVQLLADLKPAFLRFPGGCIVEGEELASRYQWKNTIGDLAERKLTENRWNTVFRHRLTPDYFQSFGLGFYEFFLLAEDIGAEPLPILNCGMACQFQSGQLVPLEELGPYIEDALDLIEFANGPVTSPWGARRAAMGHPEPFGMKLLGVGNEQWDFAYFERYEAFAKVLQEKHPEIELVSGTGPFPSDAKFRFAWPVLRALKVDIVDEHCYAMPDWFLRAATRYDKYPRTGPKVFMGEYAAQSVDITSPDNRNNLRCALAEAAFMTGLERNSDVVVMSSYAPLLGHEDAWQWRPNLIWFDNLHAYATPNYYVQQLFSQHRGDVVLPVKLSDSRPAESAMGRIGLATADCSAEFKEVKVTKGGQTLFIGDKLDGARQMTTTFGGNWSVESGVIRQSNARGNARATFGDPTWHGYTLELKGRKLAGRAGFAVIVRNSEGGSFLQWTLGGWGNRQHGIHANLATHSEDDTVVDKVSGSIEPNRWYDLRIELSGSRVRCYLDGALVHDLDIPPPDLPRLFATASRANRSGKVILKVVNPTAEPARSEIDFHSVSSVAKDAQAIVLAGDPEDENLLGQPNKIAPRTSRLEVSGSKFRHTFPPHSLSILRFDVN